MHNYVAHMHSTVQTYSFVSRSALKNSSALKNKSLD